MHTILKGKTKEVVIGIDRPFVMIGEKINPTGRKKLAAALTEGNLDYIRQLAENQVAWARTCSTSTLAFPASMNRPSPNRWWN
jgi:hypothetical protein